MRFAMSSPTMSSSSRSYAPPMRRLYSTRDEPMSSPPPGERNVNSVANPLPVSVTCVPPSVEPAGGASS